MKFPSCKSTLLLTLFVIILPDVLIAAFAQHAVKKEGHHMPSEVESPDNGASGTTSSPSSASTPTPPGGSTNVTSAPPVSSSVPSMTDQSLSLGPSSSSKQFSRTCLVNISGCGANEECVAVNSRARQGVCACQRGFVRDATGSCSLKATEGISETTVPVVTSTTTSSQTSSTFSQRLLATMNSTSTITEPTTSSTTTTTTPVPIQRLIVNATSKTAQLPFEEVTLSAFAMPPPSVDVDPHGYEYDWRLTGSVPGGNDAKGTIADTHKATLRLANLKPGTYSFVVSVKGAHSFGEAAANLTVLPPKRINKPPVVLVEPAEQTLRLPSNTALIDGSRSTDDDKIVSYKWTLETGPLGYSLSSANGEDSSGMLKLVNLTVGDYTLKLTVVDSDGASNSTLAHVRVDKEIDYPPIANAGEDIIVHLPTSSVVLDASKGSTDDRGIVTWEWTRGEGAELAVDMQNTHSPVLQLSGLIEGVYSFVLRVMDAANQTATDEVRVFVKPPDTSMVADGGKNMTITLPVNEVLLDGSASDKSGGSLVQSWNWTQISGPSQAVLESPNAAKTKVKSLTKGDYLFNLTVSDGTNFSWATVAVTVLQTENAPPKASAGPDISITLPCREVRLDGSASTDDVGIVRWEWTRLERSSAAGTVVGDSASQSILRLVDLLPGHYEFTLKVYDGQGGSSEDTASLIVKPNPNELGEVELILNANIESLTTGELRTLTEKLELLLESGAESSGVTVAVVRLYPERRTKRAVLRFIAVTRGAAGGGNEGEKETVLPGGKVAVLLRTRLKRDANLLNYDVLLVESVLCQNDCSGVGQCDQETRACRCDPFWTENPIRKHFGDMESNCDWSLVYVGIISIFLTVGLALVCVGVRKAYVKRLLKSSSAHGAREDGVSNGKSGGSKRTKHRYSLLNGFGGGRRRKRHAANGGEEMTSLTRSFDSSLMVSDSDSGSEVLFQARRSTPSIVLNGHHKAPAESSETMNGALVNLTPPAPNGFPPASPSIDEPEVVVSNGGSVAYHRPRSDDEESLNLIA